jgi:hypothetical protein
MSWPRVAVVAAVMALVGVGAWEAYWRVAQQYEPSYRNSDGQWAETRRRVDRSEPNATVFIGSSRTQFDIDLDVWEEETGVHGCSSRVSGSGRTPWSTTSTRRLRSGSGTSSRTRWRRDSRSTTSTPSSSSFWLAIVTWTWQDILEHLPPPPPPEVAQAAFEAMLEQVAADVAKIRARGGEVVFVRPPSSDWFREFERQATPREMVWESIVGAANAVGVHFEDYPELSDVRTPEWSHISSRDKARWTRALVGILRDRMTGT